MPSLRKGEMKSEEQFEDFASAKQHESPYETREALQVESHWQTYQRR